MPTLPAKPVGRDPRGVQLNRPAVVRDAAPGFPRPLAAGAGASSTLHVIQGLVVPGDIRKAVFGSDLSQVIGRPDWFRLVGSGGFEDVQGEVENWFGPLTREREGQGYNENHVAADAPVRVRLGHVRNLQRWQVEIPGSAIGYLGDAIKGPVLALIGMGGEFSRLDAAVDWRDPKGLGFMRELAAELNRQSVIRPMGEERQGTGEKAGWTQYFGSRLSDSFVRMYDKGAEQDAGSDWWIRTEAELKGKRARAATRLFTAEADWGVLCRGIVAGQMEPLRHVVPGLFHTLFEGEISQVTIPDRLRALEAYFEWLCTQVGPTLGLLAEQAGVSRLDILRASGMLEVRPSVRRSRHSGLISECREFLRGIIKNHGEEEVAS